MYTYTQTHIYIYVQICDKNGAHNRLDRPRAQLKLACRSCISDAQVPAESLR